MGTVFAEQNFSRNFFLHIGNLFKRGVVFIFIFHMKYIISEQQNQRMKMKFFHLFDATLTPVGGWNEKDWFKKLIKSPAFDHELFLSLEQTPTSQNYPDDGEHIFYASCRSPNYSFSDGECPVAIIPNSKYNMFEDLSGKEWVPYFEEWFEENTGLPVVKVISSSEEIQNKLVSI